MSYDSTDRFSNWQSGGAAVVSEPEVQVVEVEVTQPAISDNLRLFVLNAEHNDFEFAEGLFHSLTEYDWFFIWSTVEQPEDWTIVGTDLQIEYLLCDFYQYLVAAVEAEDKSVPLLAVLDNAIREADVAKAIAQEAITTLDATCLSLTNLAEETLAKYTLL